LRGLGRRHRGGAAPARADGAVRRVPHACAATAGARAARPAALAALLAAAALCLAGCSTGGTGARDEGPAHSEPVGHAATPPSPSPSETPSATARRVDPVKLVMADPLVSRAVKTSLRKPCAAGGYPVDASYGTLTGAGSSDVVVNVLTCDSIGLGAYVYRPGDNGYENVFRDEEPPVYAEIDRGDLVVRQKVYAKGDQVSYPSSEDVITYGWSASERRFTEQDRTHNDYSNAVGGEKPGAPN
jgi:hypothetical protein